MNVVQVAAGLIFHQGKLLITQRRAQDHLANLWEFPGGKLEAGESFEACLERELEEELGIQVRTGDLFEAVTHRYPEKTVHLRFFRCQGCGDQEPQPLACQAVAWVSREELSEYEFPEADRQLLERLKSTPALWL